jgi:hypothetical protein
MNEVESIFGFFDKIYNEDKDLKHDIIFKKTREMFLYISDDMLCNIIYLYILIKEISCKDNRDRIIDIFIKEHLEVDIKNFKVYLYSILDYPSNQIEKEEFFELTCKVLTAINIDKNGNPLDGARNFFPILLKKWRLEKTFSSIKSLHESIKEPLEDIGLFKGILYRRNKSRLYFEEKYKNKIFETINNLLQQFHSSTPVDHIEISEKLLKILVEQDIDFIKEYSIYPSFRLNVYDPCKSSLYSFLFGKWGRVKLIAGNILKKIPETCSIDEVNEDYNTTLLDKICISTDDLCSNYIKYKETPEVVQRIFNNLRLKISNYEYFKIYIRYLCLKSEEDTGIKIYPTLQKEFELPLKEVKRIISKTEYHMKKIVEDIGLR